MILLRASSFLLFIATFFVAFTFVAAAPIPIAEPAPVVKKALKQWKVKRGSGPAPVQARAPSPPKPSGYVVRGVKRDPGDDAEYGSPPGPKPPKPSKYYLKA